MAGGAPSFPFGRNDLWLAQAWTSVPSTKKCSEDIRAATRGCATTAAKKACAASPASSRPRFLEKVQASHAGASIDSPTNQRNSGLQSSRSINRRSERTEWNACSNKARSSFSGGTEGRPTRA